MWIYPFARLLSNDMYDRLAITCLMSDEYFDSTADIG